MMSVVLLAGITLAAVPKVPVPVEAPIAIQATKVLPAVPRIIIVKK